MRANDPNPDQRIGSLEISRPVIGGNLNELADRARYLGTEIFGTTESTNVEVELARQDDAAEDYVISRRIGRPNYRAYDRLMLPLVKLATRSGSDLHPRFYHAAGALNANVKLEIEQLGLQYDQPDQNRIEVLCDNLGLVSPGDKQGTEIVAKPSIYESTTYLFLEESKLILEALKRRSGKNFPPLEQSYEAGIPIGLIPSGASAEDINKFLLKIKKGGPYRVILGGIKPPGVS